MRSGGAVVASDIPVHRDIYRDAAQYFNPYAAPALAEALAAVIDPLSAARRGELVERGQIVSSSYLSEKILPQWQDFLMGLRGTGAGLPVVP